MKRVQVNAYQVGLVFKNGVYQRMITEGNYWLWNEDANVYNLVHPFHAPVELDILLQDQALADMLEVYEVKDHEIALQYEKGMLQQVLGPGRYAFWKGLVARSMVIADISQLEIPATIDRATQQQPKVAGFVRSFVVENHEQAIMMVDGKYDRLLSPGTYSFWKNGITVQLARVDMRQQQLEINGQEILTRDKAGLRINAWAQYRVTDAEKSVLGNKEFDKQLYVAFQLALREYVAGYGFDELLEKRDTIAPLVLEQVKEKALALGVEVTGFGIRDIILPGDMKEIMNQVLVAEKKAQANIIMRREETASTRSLLNTAKLMEENAMLWKLKEMEYVEKIADKISNISVSGNGMLIEQLKQIFVSQK
jgi:regulator of protease activity HflC (stomatin/prohibitin superfamily)